MIWLAIGLLIGALAGGGLAIYLTRDLLPAEYDEGFESGWLAAHAERDQRSVTVEVLGEAADLGRRAGSSIVGAFRSEPFEGPQ